MQLSEDILTHPLGQKHAGTKHLNMCNEKGNDLPLSARKMCDHEKTLS